MSLWLYVVRSLSLVPTAAAERFMKMAEELSSSRGAIESLAAAIAVISGNDKPRSLLTATPVRTELVSTRLLSTAD